MAHECVCDGCRDDIEQRATVHCQDCWDEKVTEITSLKDDVIDLKTQITSLNEEIKEAYKESEGLRAELKAKTA